MKNKKLILTPVLSLAAVVTTLPMVVACGSKATENKTEKNVVDESLFNVDSNGVLHGFKKDITQKEIDNYTKKGVLMLPKCKVIGEGAFRNLNAPFVNTIVVSTETTMIDDYAFYGSRAMNITYGDAQNSGWIDSELQSIGNYSFAQSQMLRMFLVSPSLTSIGEHAFDGCINISGLDLTAFQQIDGAQTGQLDEAKLNNLKIGTAAFAGVYTASSFWEREGTFLLNLPSLPGGATTPGFSAGFALGNFATELSKGFDKSFTSRSMWLGGVVKMDTNNVFPIASVIPSEYLTFKRSSYQGVELDGIEDKKEEDLKNSRCTAIQIPQSVKIDNVEYPVIGISQNFWNDLVKVNVNENIRQLDLSLMDANSEKGWDGLTSINEDFFQIVDPQTGLSTLAIPNIQMIKLPKSVFIIGDGALYNATKLTWVNLNDLGSINQPLSIGDLAFARSGICQFGSEPSTATNASNSFELDPNKTRRIGASAFANAKVKSVKFLPIKLEAIQNVNMAYIQANAFANNPIEKIDFSEIEFQIDLERSESLNTVTISDPNTYGEGEGKVGLGEAVLVYSLLDFAKMQNSSNETLPDDTNHIFEGSISKANGTIILPTFKYGTGTLPTDVANTGFSEAEWFKTQYDTQFGYEKPDEPWIDSLRVVNSLPILPPIAHSIDMNEGFNQYVTKIWPEQNFIHSQQFNVVDTTSDIYKPSIGQVIKDPVAKAGEDYTITVKFNGNYTLDRSNNATAIYYLTKDEYYPQLIYLPFSVADSKEVAGAKVLTVSGSNLDVSMDKDLLYFRLATKSSDFKVALTNTGEHITGTLNKKVEEYVSGDDVSVTVDYKQDETTGFYPYILDVVDEQDPRTTVIVKGADGVEKKLKYRSEWTAIPTAYDPVTGATTQVTIFISHSFTDGYPELSIELAETQRTSEIGIGYDETTLGVQYDPSTIGYGIAVPMVVTNLRPAENIFDPTNPNDVWLVVNGVHITTNPIETDYLDWDSTTNTLTLTALGATQRINLNLYTHPIAQYRWIDVTHDSRIKSIESSTGSTLYEDAQAEFTVTFAPGYETGYVVSPNSVITMNGERLVYGSATTGDWYYDVENAKIVIRPGVVKGNVFITVYPAKA